MMWIIIFRLLTVAKMHFFWNIISACICLIETFSTVFLVGKKLVVVPLGQNRKFQL
jgi:hypothetical protein